MLVVRPPFLPEESDTSIVLRAATRTPVSPVPGIGREFRAISKLSASNVSPRNRASVTRAPRPSPMILQRFLDDRPILTKRVSRFLRGGRRRVAGCAHRDPRALGVRNPFLSLRSTAARKNVLLLRAPALAPETSIAVLPFENLSANQENAFFADGVQDEILTDLAKVADLKVISRTSVMQYKTTASRNLPEIAQALKVAHVLVGSVQRASNRVRVTAQLIDARTDAHLWAEHYDRPLDDVFAIQSEIAKTIAEQLRAKLSPGKRRRSSSRRRSTCRPTIFTTRRRPSSRRALLAPGSETSSRKPRGYWIKPWRRIRTSLLAYCDLAGVHDFTYFSGVDHTPARLALAEKAVQNALRLRPDSGEAHLAKAQHLYQGYLEYEKALAELTIASRTLPNDPRVFELSGYIIRRQGHHEEGLRKLERAVELDPRNFATLQQVALSYEGLRRYQEMVDALDRALAIVPNDLDTKISRAQADLDWKADTRPLHNTIDALLASQPASGASFADNWLYLMFANATSLPRRAPGDARRA